MQSVQLRHLMSIGMRQGSNSNELNARSNPNVMESLWTLGSSIAIILILPAWCQCILSYSKWRDFAESKNAYERFRKQMNMWFVCHPVGFFQLSPKYFPETVSCSLSASRTCFSNISLFNVEIFSENMKTYHSQELIKRVFLHDVTVLRTFKMYDVKRMKWGETKASSPPDISLCYGICVRSKSEKNSETLRVAF